MAEQKALDSFAFLECSPAVICERDVFEWIELVLVVFEIVE